MTSSIARTNPTFVETHTGYQYRILPIPETLSFTFYHSQDFLLSSVVILVTFDSHITSDTLLYSFITCARRHRWSGHTLYIVHENERATVPYVSRPQNPTTTTTTTTTTSTTVLLLHIPKQDLPYHTTLSCHALTWWNSIETMVLPSTYSTWTVYYCRRHCRHHHQYRRVGRRRQSVHDIPGGSVRQSSRWWIFRFVLVEREQNRSEAILLLFSLYCKRSVFSFLLCVCVCHVMWCQHASYAILFLLLVLLLLLPYKCRQS